GCVERVGLEREAGDVGEVEEARGEAALCRYHPPDVGHVDEVDVFVDDDAELEAAVAAEGGGYDLLGLALEALPDRDGGGEDRRQEADLADVGPRRPHGVQELGLA